MTFIVLVLVLVLDFFDHEDEDEKEDEEDFRAAKIRRLISFLSRRKMATMQICTRLAVLD